MITFVYGVCVPSYHSMGALKNTIDDEDTQWLSYWLFFSMFMIVEKILPFLVRMIPLYYEIKLLFLAWLVHQRGALIMYKKFLDKPFDRLLEIVQNPENKKKVLNKLTALLHASKS